jgi:hypothetical protein
MPPNNTATGPAPGVAGRASTPKPKRTGTLSSIYRRATGKETSPEVETVEVFIPKYELEWDSLKEWLDKRFEGHGCTFTKRFNVVRRDRCYVSKPRVLMCVCE